MSKNSKSNRRSNPYHGRPGGGSPQAGRAAILERARREAADRASAEKAAAAEGVDVGAVAVPAADSPGGTGDALCDTLAALDSKRAIYEECAARADQREEQAARNYGAPPGRRRGPGRRRELDRSGRFRCPDGSRSGSWEPPWMRQEKAILARRRRPTRASLPGSRRRRTRSTRTWPAAANGQSMTCGPPRKPMRRP